MTRPTPQWHRLVLWLLPAQRREWGEAMLNEAAYLPASGVRRWIAGCVLAALRARLAYEWRTLIMSRKIWKAACCVSAMLTFGAVIAYANIKPYQRERLWFFVHDMVHSAEP